MSRIKLFAVAAVIGAGALAAPATATHQSDSLRARPARQAPGAVPATPAVRPGIKWTRAGGRWAVWIR